MLEQQVLIRDRLQGLGVRGGLGQIELAGGYLHGRRAAGGGRGAVAAGLRAGMVARYDGAHDRLPLEVPHRLNDLGVIDHSAAVFGPAGRAAD